MNSERTTDAAMTRRGRVRRDRRGGPEFPPETTAAILRERIYGDIACLSTLLVLTQHAVETGTAWTALVDVLVAAGALFAASALAEFVAHLGVHGNAPAGQELRKLFFTSGQILQPAVLPALLLIAAGIGWLSLHTALWASVWLLVATLGVFAFLAARRTGLSLWGRLLLVAALLALGAVVVLVKVLAH